MAPYITCRNAKPKNSVKLAYVVSSKSSRCSECARKGYSKCDVTVSRMEWERLRDSCDKLRKELFHAEDDEERLA